MPTQLVTRGATWPIHVDLVVEHCCNCGMPFAMPQEVYKELRRHSSASDLPTKAFYCPAGHAQHYTGKNDEQLLRDRLERVERDREFQREQRLAAERSNVALRGVVTRTQRRVGNGVCPCCGRQFSALQRHMSAKHPEYVAETSQQAPPAPEPLEFRCPASTSTIRRWATANGFAVSRQGRLPGYVLTAYKQRFAAAESTT